MELTNRKIKNIGLQFFAEGATENTENTNVESEQEETVTFTRSELEDLLQKNGDKRVSQALKTAEKKNAEKLKESEKLARMNEQEKFQYQLEQREQAIVEKEKALALAENKNEASKILADKGISLSLVDFVVAEDAETMNANITILDKAFKASVKAEVEKRLGSAAPKMNLPPDTAITKEAFRKMTLIEQAELANTNPQLYKELTN